MSVFDIIVLAVLAVGAVLGFFKGIVKTLLRLAQIIVVLGLSALAAMCTVWFGLVSMDAISNLGSGGFGSIIESGVIFFLVAFLVMAIVSAIATDFIINKIIYGKMTFKQAVWDRIIGCLIGIIASSVVVFFVFGVFVALEGTEFDLYVQVCNGPIASFFYKCNPFAGILKDSSVTKVIITILNAFWSNFEYLG